MSLNPSKPLKKNVGKKAVRMEVGVQSRPCQGSKHRSPWWQMCVLGGCGAWHPSHSVSLPLCCF